MEGLWIQMLPLSLPKIAPLALVLIGIVVEKRFIGRITVFANTLAINTFLLSLTSVPNLAFVPEWLVARILVLYANAGILLGVVALISYATNSSLPSWMYTIFWAYSSIVVGLLILFIGPS